MGSGSARFREHSGADVNAHNVEAALCQFDGDAPGPAASVEDGTRPWLQAFYEVGFKSGIQ